VFFCRIVERGGMRQIIAADYCEQDSFHRANCSISARGLFVRGSAQSLIQ
jgi:hypothetical protein